MEESVGDMPGGTEEKQGKLQSGSWSDPPPD
jgi:hypothetical protein